MGSLTTGQQKVDAILEILPKFADSLAEAERWLSCRDQVKQLTVAVENILTQAHLAQEKANLDFRIGSETASKQKIVNLAIYAAFWMFDGRAPSRSDKASPAPRLGKVVIAVGPGGLPEDLMVVNVSEVAEREGTTDGQVEAAYAEKEHVLFTVEEFKSMVSWLKDEVLSGRVSLPYQPPRPTLNPAVLTMRLRISR